MCGKRFLICIFLVFFSSFVWSEDSATSAPDFSEKVQKALDLALDKMHLSKEQAQPLTPVFQLFEDQSKADSEKSQALLDHSSQSLTKERQDRQTESLTWELATGGALLLAVLEGIALVIK